MLTAVIIASVISFFTGGIASTLALLSFISYSRDLDDMHAAASAYSKKYDVTIEDAMDLMPHKK